MFPSLLISVVGNSTVISASVGERLSGEYPYPYINIYICIILESNKYLYKNCTDVGINGL